MVRRFAATSAAVPVIPIETASTAREPGRRPRARWELTGRPRVVMGHLFRFVLCLVLLEPVEAFAATDFILKIDGISGESRITGHVGEIDVLSFEWVIGPTDAKRPVVCPKELAVIKYFDAASPPLALAALSRSVLGEARLVGRRGGPEPVEYLVLTLKNVRIDRYETSASAGDDRVLEKVGFRFTEIAGSYTGVDDLGSQKPPIAFTHQVVKACLPK